MSSCTSWLAAALAAVAGSLLAAQSPPGLPSEATYVHFWPEAGTPLGFRILRAHCCRLGHDDRVDVALLSTLDNATGTTRRSLVYLPDAGSTHACVPLGLAQDYAVLPGAGTEGCDALLSVMLDGTLVVHSWLPGQPLPVARIVDSWPGTIRLWAVPNGTTIDIFGLDLMGVRLRRATWSQQGLGPVTITTALPGTSDIQGMDWDGDGVLELVVGVEGGAAVRRWNESPVATIPIGSVAPLGTSPMFQVSHSTRSDLLVSYVSDGVNTGLFWANGSTSGYLPLGTLAISAIAAYDRDGDGNEDIVLADAAHSKLYVFQRTGDQFVPAAVPLLTGSAAPDVGLTAVTGADLDGDGDGDLMAWSTGSALTHTFLDGLVAGLRPAAATGDLWSAVLGPQTTIPIRVTLPPGLPALAAGGAPGTSLRLRLDGWLVDPRTDLVIPQRVLGQELAIAGTEGTVQVPITFALPSAMAADFLLQLQIAVVAVYPDGRRHSYPSHLLLLTPSPERELSERGEVEVERTGSFPLQVKDGGGDGNILGTKATKNDVGSPPF